MTDIQWNELLGKEDNISIFHNSFSNPLNIENLTIS